VFVFSAGAKGDVAPIRTIAGSKTQLSSTHGLGVDSSGYIYVLAGGICVFSPTANGNVAPVRFINGSKTELGVNTQLIVH
jgi:hypothetical protein